MPSSMTHAYFGNAVYSRLDKKYKDLVDIYYIRLFSQGSDPYMFYHFFVGKRAYEISLIQEMIHTKKTNIFFKNIIRYINKFNLLNNKEVMSYLYGFICHYYLDLYVHPFIYYKSGIFNKLDKTTYKYNCKHQEYEYLIDLYLIEIVLDIVVYL